MDRSAPIAAVAAALLAGCLAPPAPPSQPAATCARPGSLPRTGSALPRAASPTALRLEDAVAVALRHNPDLVAAAARIEEARAQIVAARSAFWPQITGALEYARTNQPAAAFAMLVSQRRFSPGVDVNRRRATQNVRPEIRARVSLFRGLADLHGLEAAERSLAARRLERRAAELLVRDAVAEAYYLALAAAEQRRVAEQAGATVERELELARLRLEHGAALPADVLSLEVRLAAARTARLQAEAQRAAAEAALRRLLAWPEHQPLQLAAQPPAEPPPPPALSHALRTAVAARPEIAAARALREASEQQLAAARAERLPRLAAEASYGHDNDTLALSRRRDNWSVGLALELDLFTGGRRAAAVAAARARVREARAAERRQLLEVEAQVRTALQQLALERERLALARVAARQAEEALRLVEARFRAGAAPVTRFLEAQLAWTEARSAEVAARFAAARAHVALQTAMGGVAP